MTRLITVGVAIVAADLLLAQGACCGGPPAPAAPLHLVAAPSHVPPLPAMIGQEQAPARTDYSRRCSWWGHRDNPDILMLYFGDQLLGVLDPEAASWRWTIDGKRHDLIAVLTGKPRDTGHKPGVGALPPAIEQGPSTGKPVGRTGDSSSAAQCQCDNCECKDGRVSPNCTCGKGSCRCADVAGQRHGTTADEWNRRLIEAGLPPLPTSSPAKPNAGVEEKDGGGPDGRQHAGDVIDGSPRNQDFRLGGVDASKLTGVPRYQINDRNGPREVGAAEALSAITAGSVPDDSKLIRITVIGGEAQRKRVVNDLNNAASLAWLECQKGTRCVLNDYGPQHWRVRDGGFVTPATPDGVVIYAQLPDGKVIWRQDNYEGGAEVLARALRDKVPGYDPNKDPSPNKPKPAPLAPSPSPLGPLPANPWWLATPLGPILVWLFARFRKVPA